MLSKNIMPHIKEHPDYEMTVGLRIIQSKNGVTANIV